MAFDRERVRIEQELARVAANAVLGGIRTVHPVAVALARTDAGKVRVPREGVHLLERQPGLRTLLVEKAELDLLGDLAEQSEVRAVAVERGAQRICAPRPYLPRAVSQSWLRVWLRRPWDANPGIEHVVRDRARARDDREFRGAADDAHVGPHLNGI